MKIFSSNFFLKILIFANFKNVNLKFHFMQKIKHEIAISSIFTRFKARNMLQIQNPFHFDFLFTGARAFMRGGKSARAKICRTAIYLN